jgi:hypothetical protein
VSTGHDLIDLSALWEYLNARISLCILGAICLELGSLGWRTGRRARGWCAPCWFYPYP